MRLPFAISVPHCSSRIHEDIRPSIALTDKEILESADLGTRELFTRLPVRVILWARWSRLMVDLNRGPRQRDSRGVVPDVDYYERRLYEDNDRPGEEEVEERLKKYYWPYHHRLREVIQSSEIKILFDCHSLTRIGPPGAPDPHKRRKDIVLGNNGDHRGDVNPSLGELTCPAESLQMMRKVFIESGFSISINDPYSGGFITTHYGADLVGKGKMAVQIEICQDLYLERGGLTVRRDKLADISKRLDQVFQEIAKKL